jgi:hypothetical protein
MNMERRTRRTGISCIMGVGGGVRVECREDHE